MPTSTLSSKGQIVIPKPVRSLLGLHPGDVVDFVVQESGEVVLRPAVGDVRRLRGILRALVRQPVSLEEMDLAIRSRGGRRS
jgi:antitoxin PrlF